jgi:hypothetical protein
VLTYVGEVPELLRGLVLETGVDLAQAGTS